MLIFASECAALLWTAGIPVVWKRLNWAVTALWHLRPVFRLWSTLCLFSTNLTGWAHWLTDHWQYWPLCVVSCVLVTTESYQKQYIEGACPSTRHHVYVQPTVCRDTQPHIGKPAFAENGAAVQQGYRSHCGMVSTAHAHYEPGLFWRTALLADALAYACMDILTLGNSSQLYLSTSA